MKTIGFYLNELPEPYRKKALIYLMKDKILKLTTPCESAQIAVRGSFIWATTDDGHEYWEDFYNTLK